MKSEHLYRENLAGLLFDPILLYSVSLAGLLIVLILLSVSLAGLLIVLILLLIPVSSMKPCDMSIKTILTCKSFIAGWTCNLFIH